MLLVLTNSGAAIELLMPAGPNVDLVKEKTEGCETNDWWWVQFFQKCEEDFIVSRLTVQSCNSICQFVVAQSCRRFECSLKYLLDFGLFDL